MASTAAPSFSLLHHTRKGENANARRRNRCMRVFATNDSGEQPPVGQRKGNPGVDTRIHWENPDEGWIGGKTTKTDGGDRKKEEEILGEKFADLLKNSTDSHYQFLGISTEADLEEIKAAYRRLSKEYHPDTTSLPMKVASDKFMQLREVYDVLSNEERRRFYDWTLAQEAASRQAERMKMKLEDPYEQDLKNWESVPDMVDRLGGKNLELSDQAMTALTIDVGIIIFAICCIIYVVAFKEPY
ncbi:NAD(P)H-quinone oxidoreductase subunit T, chloroplastic [Magnolia sinica]|uniref:NAD(P)H-quinone oxidoreductase subunit T, chloroplastic n=1 Tax=Magnolia sinica TaxID=86752 RepID=UPI00265817D2|nr:NAD(P)H-quinone oxidoreductase subunit T, chloroplastic [Magnolia sinica]